MTIQKLSSGSKKNCRFFCVCRDLAGFVGQNVLEDRRHDRVNKGDTAKQDDQPLLQILDMYQCVSGHLLQHFPILLYLKFKEIALFFWFSLTQLVKLSHEIGMKVSD